MWNVWFEDNVRTVLQGAGVVGLAVLLSFLLFGPAKACSPQVRIDFVEDSPDRFRISFLHGPDLRLERLTIRLSSSAAGAYFEGDTLAAARSYKQPHPKSAGVGLQSLRYATGIDADAVLTFSGFIAGRVYDLHSDLDDLTRARDQDGDHIADGELEGATASAQLQGNDGKPVQIFGTFGKQSSAVLGPKACV